MSLHSLSGLVCRAEPTTGDAGAAGEKTFSARRVSSDGRRVPSVHFRRRECSARQNKVEKIYGSAILWAARSPTPSTAASEKFLPRPTVLTTTLLSPSSLTLLKKKPFCTPRQRKRSLLNFFPNQVTWPRQHLHQDVLCCELVIPIRPGSYSLAVSRISCFGFQSWDLSCLQSWEQECHLRASRPRGPSVSWRDAGDL
jgi:hypothetical protein